MMSLIKKIVFHKHFVTFCYERLNFKTMNVFLGIFIRFTLLYEHEKNIFHSFSAKCECALDVIFEIEENSV